MKKETQNTLVYDFIGTAFCLVMAFALTLMLSGCSNDESKQPIGSLGGAEEETGIYALSGRAGNILPKLMNITDTTEEIIDSMGSGESVFAPKGSIVTVFELDSLTLDTTGLSFTDTISNDSGFFTFEELPITSPYVMIQVQDSCYTANCEERIPWKNAISDNSPQYSTKQPQLFYAIVDLRKHQKITVNSLTDKKARWLKENFADGMSFDEASQKAQRDILEEVGIYDDLGDFEDLNDDNYELGLVWILVNSKPFSTAYLLQLYNRFYYTSQAVYAESEQYYSNTKKLLEYMIAAIAQRDSLGQCTESREDETVGSFVCRSNKWELGYKKIEYTGSVMQDTRDGKTYKTVTYHWGNVTQTWMAENLNFADTTSSSVDPLLKKNLRGGTTCMSNDPSCEINGRFYAWRVAMNLDSSVKMIGVGYTNAEADTEIVLENQCALELPHCLDLDLSKHREETTYYDYSTKEFVIDYCSVDDYADSIYRYCDKTYQLPLFHLDYSTFISQSRPIEHQGVCPDGWRIPNNADWETLFDNVAEQYGIKRENVWSVLADNYATGFGYMVPTPLEVNEQNVLAFKTLSRKVNSFASVPDVDANESYDNQLDLAYPVYYYTVSGPETPIPSNKYDNFLMESQYYPVSYEALNELVLVRCIKN